MSIKNVIFKWVKWIVIIVLVLFLILLCYVIFSSDEIYENEDFLQETDTLSYVTKSPEDIVKEMENNPEHYSLKEIAEFYQKDEMDDYKERIFSLFCKGLSLCSVDELIQQIKTIKPDTLYYVTLDSLEFKAFHKGALEISKVYKANLDEDWECLIEPFVIESLDEMTLVEHKELLPYFIETSYEDEIKEMFCQRTSDSLLTLKSNYINYVAGVIKRDIVPMINNDVTLVYEDFFGGFLGWNNFKNNVFKKKENTNSEFDKIWKQHINADNYNNIYQTAIQDSLNYYLKARKLLAKDLGVEDNTSLKPSKIPLYYDKDAMRYAVEHNKWIAFKDVTCVGIDLLTLPLGGVGEWLFFVGSFGIDIGLDYIPILDNPEKYFKYKESMIVYNQFLNDAERQSEEMQANDQQLIEEILRQQKNNYE